MIRDPRLPDVTELGGGVHHVALGEDAADLAALLHDHRADAVLLHDLGGMLQRLVGVNRDHRALIRLRTCFASLLDRSIE